MINFVEEKLREGFTKYHIHGLDVDAVIHVIDQPDFGIVHDHPYDFTSFIISGSYVEKYYYLQSNGLYGWVTYLRKAGDVLHIPAERIHEIVSLPDGKCETLILPGPWKRKWGFWTFENGKAEFREH